MSEPITIQNCCSKINPCEALCLLNEAALNLALGKSLLNYKVGDETFSLVKPSLSDINVMIAHYERLCPQEAPTPVRRRRAKVCFVYGPNVCGSCRTEMRSCRCR